MKKRQIPQHLKDLIQTVGMTLNEATWDCHGIPIVYHEALERIAEHVGITFEVPTTIESKLEKGIFCCHYVGTDGDKIAESYGEATPQNNKNAYASAMAEKRAKDRVILKLIGLSGQVYSNDEADWKQIEKERKEEERRKKVEQNQEVKKEEPPPFEPDPNSVSIIKTAQDKNFEPEYIKSLQPQEYDMVLLYQKISKLIDAADANQFANKNKNFMDIIERKYPTDFDVICTEFEKKCDEFEGEEND